MKNKISLQTQSLPPTVAARLLIRSAQDSGRQKVVEPRHWSSDKAKDAHVKASSEALKSE